MKPFLSICILCLSTALPADANTDEGGQPDTHANELQGHQPIGKPGNEAPIDRTIEVTITETSSGYMLFDPDAIHFVTLQPRKLPLVKRGMSERSFWN